MVYVGVWGSVVRGMTVHIKLPRWFAEWIRYTNQTIPKYAYYMLQSKGDFIMNNNATHAAVKINAF